MFMPRLLCLVVLGCCFAMNRLIASHTRNIFLKPGEVVVAYDPALVSSVLGSCVAVTLYSPGRQIGSICHAMMPDCGGQVDDLRYVDAAVGYIYRKMRAAGATDLVVKLFGGAQVLDINNYSSEKMSVGEQNVARAELALAELGLVVAARDTGGLQGRKLFFCTRDGDVYLHRLNRGKM